MAMITVRCASWVTDQAAEGIAEMISRLEGVTSAKVIDPLITLPDEDDE